jgi:hypothetical protein
MTRNQNARLAGFTFLFYIAVGITSMVVFGQAIGEGDIAAKLERIAQHSTSMGAVFVLTLLQGFCALVLAVSLHAITREQDRDLAMLGMAFRIGEGLIAMAVPSSLALLWLATTSSHEAPDAGAARALGAFLMALNGWTTITCATFFAVGSALFSWLFLRGRMIPTVLASLGLVASVILVVALPLQGGGFLRGRITSVIWIPMLLFEVPLAVWLLTKGVSDARVIAPPLRAT